MTDDTTADDGTDDSIDAGTDDSIDSGDECASDDHDGLESDRADTVATDSTDTVATASTDTVATDSTDTVATAATDTVATASTDTVATDGGSVEGSADDGLDAESTSLSDTARDLAGIRSERASEQAASNAVDPDLLRARVDVLAEENDRLRREYVRARRTQYRRSAAAMAIVGLFAIGGAIVFPLYREVLLALGGTGLFGAALTYYLTPERFVAASVAERVQAAHAANQTAMVEDLGLLDERVYVPTDSAPEPARLFVPQRPEFEPPTDPEHLLVVPDDPTNRGVAFVPTGAPLYEEFEATVTGEPGSDPATLAAQLADAVVEAFELASSAGTEPDLEGDRIVLTVTDPVLGDLDAPDHPIVSVVGTGLAAGLDRPVTATVTEQTGSDARVAFEWREEWS